jgi:three-Cys-motif partner protein
VPDPYQGREQTGAKHFILRRYLQALAFKVLRFSDITYVDGFSGPWETRTEDFADSSFMIAITVLRDAQAQLADRTGRRRRIRCFFSEIDPSAHAQLAAAVTPHHRPAEDFEVQTYCGKFEEAVPAIQAFVGRSFPLIFIDPTGWTGYPFAKIKLLFDRPKVEVLINFIYEFINRFAHSEDAETIASLDPILGGPGWRERLDPALSRGLAVEKLFRETLKAAGNFQFVVSTKIDKATAERPQFFIAYATKSQDGLIAFRQTEYDALREHARSRAGAKEQRRLERTGSGDLFADHDANVHEASIDEIVQDQAALATRDLLDTLARGGPLPFASVVAGLLQAYMLRETNVKDLCVNLAKAGRIETTWGGGARKPREGDVIRLIGA